jgi:hypothetical protein
MITIAYDLGEFSPYSGLIYGNIQLVGWAFMVIGFALVLYSHLHLVIQNPQVRHFLPPVLLSIILVSNIIIFVFIYVAAYIPSPSLSTILNRVLFRVEVLFPVQEIIMASLYTYFFMGLLRENSSETLQSERKMFYSFCAAQALIVICDVGMAVAALDALTIIRTIFNPFLYAVKLEFEFMVLNSLIFVSRRREGRFQDIEGERRTEVVAAQISAMLTPTKRDGETMESEKGVFGLSVANSSMVTASNFNLPVPGELHLEQMSSIEEMEKRYLGRTGDKRLA